MAHVQSQQLEGVTSMVIKDVYRCGYRLNVGIVIANQAGRLFLARRSGSRSWQFPQGGVRESESFEEAMLRELYEEVGLLAADIEIVAKTKKWYQYEIPPAFQRPDRTPCLGQRQRWFLLRMLSDDARIDLNVSHHPEFTVWRWTDYWQPLEEVVAFKKEIYQGVLREFESYLK